MKMSNEHVMQSSTSMLKRLTSTSTFAFVTVGLIFVILSATTANGEPAAGRIVPQPVIYAKKSPVTLSLLDQLLTARKQTADILDGLGLNTQKPSNTNVDTTKERLDGDYIEPITYHPTFEETQKPTEKPVIIMSTNGAKTSHEKTVEDNSHRKSVLRISAYDSKVPKSTADTGQPLQTATRRDSYGHSNAPWSHQREQIWGQGSPEKFKTFDSFGPRYKTGQKDDEDRSYWRLEIDTSNPKPSRSQQRPKSTYKSGDGWAPVASSSEKSHQQPSKPTYSHQQPTSKKETYFSQSTDHIKEQFSTKKSTSSVTSFASEKSHQHSKPTATITNEDHKNYQSKQPATTTENPRSYKPAESTYNQKPLEETYFSQATDYANAEFSSKLADVVEKYNIKFDEEEQNQGTSNDEQAVSTDQENEATGYQRTNNQDVKISASQEQVLETSTKKIDAVVAMMTTDNSASEAFPGLSSLSDFISKAVNDAISKQFEAQKAGTDASRKTTEAAAEITKQHQKQSLSAFKSDDAADTAPSGNKRRRRPRPYRRYRRRKNQRRRPSYYDEEDYYDEEESTATGKGGEESVEAVKKEEPPPVELFAGPLPADKQGEGDNPLGFASVKVNPNFSHHMQAPVVISQKTLQLGRKKDSDEDDDIKPTALGFNPKKGPFGAMSGLNSHFGGSLGGLFGGPGGKALAKSHQNPLLQQAKAREAAYNPLKNLQNYQGIGETPQLSQLNQDTIGGGGVVSRYNTNSDEDVFDELSGLSGDDLDGLIELLSSYKQGLKGNFGTAGPNLVAQTGIGVEARATAPPPPPPPAPPTTTSTTMTTTTTTPRPAPVINIITPDALFPHLFESGKLDYSKLTGLTEYLGQSGQKKRSHTKQQVASLYNRRTPSRSQLRQRTAPAASPLHRSKVTLTAGELQRALAVANVGGQLRPTRHTHFSHQNARLPYAALPVRLPTTPSSPPTTLQQLVDAQRMRYYPHSFNNIAGRKIIPLAKHPRYPGKTFGLPPVIQVPRRKKTTGERALDALPNSDRELLAEALYEQYRKVQSKNSFGDLEATKQDALFGQFDDAFGQFYGLKRKRRDTSKQ